MDPVLPRRYPFKFSGDGIVERGDFEEITDPRNY
jgi:hypothetical protein